MPENNYEKALNMALASAFEDLQDRDLRDVAFKSGASQEGEGDLKLSYLNTSLKVEVHGKQVLTDQGPAEKRISILALHYLHRASGSPLTGQMIGFKEVPQGSLYFQPFRNRVILSMLGMLEKNPSGFEACAKQLQGERIQAGDLSYRFRVFPYVTVQYVWYAGEEGIPSDLNLLFDASISEYLSTEDIVVMCEALNRHLKSIRPHESGQK
jgi:hypothetical protein